MKDKNRNLLRLGSVVPQLRIGNGHTFEKCSYFDPSEKVISIINVKWISPLHLGNEETLCKVQLAARCHEDSFTHWSSTFFIACRPAALIFSFRTSHMWSSNSPRWNAWRRSNDRARYGSELLRPQKTFYQMQLYVIDIPLIDMSFTYLNISCTITLEEFFSFSSCIHCTSPSIDLPHTLSCAQITHCTCAHHISGYKAYGTGEITILATGESHNTPVA